jgi:hypothetical protein
VLGEHDDLGARSEAMRAMVGSRRCAGYEIWAEGRMVEAYER